jgi:hypothetical protein
VKRAKINSVSASYILHPTSYIPRTAFSKKGSNRRLKDQAMSHPEILAAGNGKLGDIVSLI